MRCRRFPSWTCLLNCRSLAKVGLALSSRRLLAPMPAHVTDRASSLSGFEGNGNSLGDWVGKETNMLLDLDRDYNKKGWEKKKKVTAGRDKKAFLFRPIEYPGETGKSPVASFVALGVVFTPLVLLTAIFIGSVEYSGGQGYKSPFAFLDGCITRCAMPAAQLVFPPAPFPLAGSIPRRSRRARSSRRNPTRGMRRRPPRRPRLRRQRKRRPSRRRRQPQRRRRQRRRRQRRRSRSFALCGLSPMIPGHAS